MAVCHKRLYPRIYILLRKQNILAIDGGISISQAALTLKATTHNLTRYAIIPLAIRYRAYQMFDVCRIHGTMSANTMDARCQSTHDEKYCQVFGSKKSLWRHIQSKKISDCHIGLDTFAKEYGAPNKITYDSAQ